MVRAPNVVIILFKLKGGGDREILDVRVLNSTVSRQGEQKAQVKSTILVETVRKQVRYMARLEDFSRRRREGTRPAPDGGHQNFLVERPKNSARVQCITTPVCLQCTHSWRIRSARSATLAGLQPF